MRGQLGYHVEDFPAIGSIQTVSGIFDFATDNATGGTIIFDFTTPTQPASIAVIDIDDNAGANVRLYNVMGNVRTYAVPDEWTGDLPDGEPGDGDPNLTTLADQPDIRLRSSPRHKKTQAFKPDSISRLEVQRIGSGSIDNLVLMTVPEPPSLTGLLWVTLAAVRFIHRPRS